MKIVQADCAWRANSHDQISSNHISANKHVYRRNAATAKTAARSRIVPNCMRRHILRQLSYTWRVADESPPRIRQCIHQHSTADYRPPLAYVKVSGQTIAPRNIFRKILPRFDSLACATYFFVTSGSADACENKRMKRSSWLAAEQAEFCLFILDKGKPVAKRRRKAMGPLRVARLPKG